MHEQSAQDSRWGRLTYWLENVFWYHYKWYYFAGVFAAVLIIASVVSFATRVTYDWTVSYVHTGSADPEGVSTVKARFLEAGTDVSGNGKVQVAVREYYDTGAPGRQDLFGLVQDSDNVLYVLDGETLALFQKLGYFGEGKPLGGDLYAVLRDTPVTPYTWEEFEAYGYTEQNWLDSNAYREEQHALLVQAAETVLGSL